MKIFISYGHDCTKFIKKISKDLEKRGHQVWMDYSKLYSGTDWRNAIAEGIIHSQAVLLFLSAHSLRPESVCHDEISISVACNRRIVRPVLMENGIFDIIPKTINGIQYFDFSEWKEFEDDNNWYESKIKELLTELEKLNNDSYEQQMDALNVVLRPSILKGKLLRELQKPFCDRYWIDDYLKKWLNYGKKEPLLLIGFPGSGKSCYCTHYFQNSPSVISLIFCEWGKEHYNDAGQIIRNMAYQIASKVTTFRNRLLWILNSNPVSLQSLNERELFDILIIEPLLYEIDGQHEPLVIVLDGLDEATIENDNILAQLVSEKMTRLPYFVHVLITTRNDTPVLRYYVGANVLEIKANDKNVRADLKEFLKKQLNSVTSFSQNRSKQTLINKIVEVCEGSFLLAHLISNGIIEGGIRIDDKRLIPNDIYSIYFQWMGRLVSGKTFENNYYDIFSVLAALEKPITISLLKRILNWKTPKMNEFVRRFKSFLLEETDVLGNKCLMLFHNTFRQWLCDEDGFADVYCVSIDDGAKLLAEESFKAFKEQHYNTTDLINLRYYVKLAGITEWLQQLNEDDNYLKELVKLARSSIKDPKLYLIAKDAVAQSEVICSYRQNTEFVNTIKEISIPVIKATGYFYSGDHFYVTKTLAPYITFIENQGNEKDVMESLYMLGTSCDLLGKRDESLNYFNRLLLLSEKYQNDFYRNRAIVGLAWNSHFSDINKLITIIQRLTVTESDNSQENAMYNLIVARSLLSKGQLNDALHMFTEALQNVSQEIWGYDYLAARNQMLLIEAIVACYDNEEFELGIKYGLNILEHLKGRGSIAECYCASWIAMNYLMNGLYDEADAYLSKAEIINKESNSSPKSNWINMHLLSVRAFWLKEKSDINEALKHHEIVVRMAKECSDPWVLGDAYFEIILLYLEINNSEETALIKKLATELENVALLSKLPHLLFKSKLINGLIHINVSNKYVTDLLEDVKSNLPSTDLVLTMYLCLKIIRNNQEQEFYAILEKEIKKEIELIAQKNPNGNYIKRTFIRRVIKELTE